MVFAFGEGLQAPRFYEYVSALAPKDHVAGTVAPFFLAGYGSLSLPVIGIGIALQYLSVRVTLLGFAVLVGIAVVAALPALHRTVEP